MNIEWTELKTIEDVACAIREKWDIQYERFTGAWCAWEGRLWSTNMAFRGRPKQPKKVIMTSECWRYHDGQVFWKNPGWEPVTGYKRFPAGDITGEIEE